MILPLIGPSPFSSLTLDAPLIPNAVETGLLLLSLAEHIRYFPLTVVANITLVLALERAPNLAPNPIGLPTRVRKIYIIKSKSSEETNPPTPNNQGTTTYNSYMYGPFPL